MSRRFSHSFLGSPNFMSSANRRPASTSSVYQPTRTSRFSQSSAASEPWRDESSRGEDAFRASAASLFRVHSSAARRIQAWELNAHKNSPSQQHTFSPFSPGPSGGGVRAPGMAMVGQPTMRRSGPPNYYEEQVGFYGGKSYDRAVFGKALYLTLKAEGEGFSHPYKILEKLWDTYGIDGNEVAERNGFLFFEQLLKSPQFADEVNFEKRAGLPCIYTYSNAKSNKYKM